MFLMSIGPACTHAAASLVTNRGWRECRFAQNSADTDNNAVTGAPTVSPSREADSQ